MQQSLSSHRRRRLDSTTTMMIVMRSTNVIRSKTTTTMIDHYRPRRVSIVIISRWIAISMQSYSWWICEYLQLRCLTRLYVVIEWYLIPMNKRLSMKSRYTIENESIRQPMLNYSVFISKISIRCIERGVLTRRNRNDRHRRRHQRVRIGRIKYIRSIPQSNNSYANMQVAFRCISSTRRRVKVVSTRTRTTIRNICEMLNF